MQAGRCYGYDSAPVDGATGSNWSSTRTRRRSSAASSRCRLTGNRSRPLRRPSTANAFPPRDHAAERNMQRGARPASGRCCGRDLYVGKVIWNSSRFVKVAGHEQACPSCEAGERMAHRGSPGTSDRRDELWQRVQERQKRMMACTAGAKKGLIPRSVTSPYLLSGILKCGGVRRGT